MIAHKVERHKQVGLSCILISEGEYQTPQDATKRINTIDKLPVMHFWDNLQPYLLDVNEDTSKKSGHFLPRPRGRVPKHLTKRIHTKNT